jgi:NitT/TauT family transport system substrate-binding protein
MKIPRSLLGALVAATSVVLVVLTVQWLDRPPSPEPLVLAVSKSKLGLPFWVAEGQGFFTAEGLAVTLERRPTGKRALEAMLAGQAEVATVAETPIMFAALAGVPLRVIANYAASDEQSVVARADLGIHQVTDLAGRRVGVSRGTTAHYFLHVLLSDQGLSESAVELVDLPAPEQAAALAAGRVAAVSTFAPYSTECRRALGDRAQSFPSGSRYRGYANLVTTPDFLHRRPEAVLRLLRATARAILWMRTHRQEAIALAAELSNSEIAVVEETWDWLRPNLALDQAFVILLQSEARWAIGQGLAPGAVPLDFPALIDAAPLARLYPEAITLIPFPSPHPKPPPEAGRESAGRP